MAKMPVFEKNFYIEHPHVTARTDDWAAEWRNSKTIYCVGSGIPKPCMTFEEASMPEYVLKEVLKQGFKERKCIYFFLGISAFSVSHSVLSRSPSLYKTQLPPSRVKAGPWLC